MTELKEIKKSIFSMDVYSIGRLKYFIDSLIITLGGVLLCAVLGFIYALFVIIFKIAISTEMEKIFFTTIIIISGIIIYLPMLHFYSLNNAKRLYAIEWADENNAIKRGMILTYGTLALSFIPYLGILVNLLAFIVWLILLFKPTSRNISETI